MNQNTMKFKGYTWLHNPSKINISSIRDVKEINLPYAGCIYQDYGRKKRVVRGNGEFFGPDCRGQFNTLFALFKKEGSGYLTVPGISPFLAVFRVLEMTESPGPSSVQYSFEFWEDMSVNDSSVDTGAGYHIVVSGETLWDIAIKYGKTAEELLKLNGDIKNPNELTPGEKVMF